MQGAWCDARAMIPFKVTRTLSRLSLIIVLITSAQAFAAEPSLDPDDYEIALVPVFTSPPSPGAFGSLWSSQLWIRNVGDEPAVFSQGPPECNIGCQDDDHHSLAPKTTAQIKSVAAARDGQPGFVLHLQREGAFAFNLRVHDLSRQAETWGTEIPVVRERDLLHESAVLLNVPQHVDFRVLLRAYSVPGRVGDAVLLRIYPRQGNELLAERRLPLDDVVISFADFPTHPGYVELYISPDEFPAIGDYESLRLELTPTSEDLPFWAFATVTHNESQHVTTIMPQGN